MNQIAAHSIAQALLLAQAVRSVEAERGLLRLAIATAAAPLAMGGKGCDRPAQALQSELTKGLQMP